MKRFQQLSLLFLLLIGAVVVFALSRAITVEQSSVGVRTMTETSGAPHTTGDATSLIEQSLVIPVDAWKQGTFSKPVSLLLPNNFSIQIFAVGFQKPRMMAWGPNDILYLTDAESDAVFALPDEDRNGIADRVIEVANDFSYPTGIAWYDQALYIADTTKVYRLSHQNQELRFQNKDIIIDNLPRGGQHITRTIAFDPDGYLYVSVGSSCNICQDDERRAAILRFTAEGKNEMVYAEGLRNAVGLIYQGSKFGLLATDNGSDNMGDDIPPDELNKIDGQHYGWPECYGNKIPTVADSKDFCETTVPPLALIPAHSAPLGLQYLSDNTPWPSLYKNSVFVALHGSWNRTVPTGYKIIRIAWDSAGTPHLNDFVSGWLHGTEVIGRPVDVLFDNTGNLFITDDKNGVVYRVSYNEPQNNP